MLPPMKNQRDYDDEIATMLGLATALTERVAQQQFVFPPPAISKLPGVSIVTSEQQGDPNADAREDRS